MTHGRCPSKLENFQKVSNLIFRQKIVKFKKKMNKDFGEISKEGHTLKADQDLVEQDKHVSTLC